MTTHTIDCTPTVQGFKHMRRMFQETIASSEKKIALCDAYLSGELKLSRLPESLVCEALELVLQQEAERVESMREGIAEASKGIPAGE